MGKKSSQPLEVFYCYAHEDHTLREELDKHLTILRRFGLITPWYDGEIVAGVRWEKAIEDHLNTADVILLLVSPDFLHSDYCYSKEMKHAIKRHQAGNARVIPVLLRPVDWTGAPFSVLQALPSDARPVTLWPDRDEAFEDVAKGIRRVVNDLLSQRIIAPERRVVIIGLAGLSVVALAGGSLLWLTRFQQSSVPAFLTVGTTLYTYRDHFNRIYSASWSPDSKYIASGSADKTVQVWNALDGNRAWVNPGPAIVGFVDWSPDGTRIASSSDDHSVSLWNATTGANILTYHQHTNIVHAVVWSHDNKHIASSSDDGTVRIWDATTGNTLQTISVHSRIWGVTWSPNDQYIAFGCSNHTVQVWDTVNGKHIWTHQGHLDWVIYVVWSPDGTHIASGSSDQTAQVWNVASKSHVSTYRGHSDDVWGLAWSPDSKYIASGSADKTVQVWGAVNAVRIFTYRGHSDSILPVVWSPNGKYLASGSNDKTVQVWIAP